MSDYLDRISADITHLVDPYTHREELTPLAAKLHGRHTYTAQHPSLLDQLRACIHPGSSETYGVRSIPGSTPPASEDALYALMRIETSTIRWLTRDFSSSLRSSLEANLRALLGEATRPIWDNEHIRGLAYDTSAWVTWARTETGWQARPLTIPDPCPHCDTTHSLRIRRPDADHAWCTHCGNAWSEHHPDLPSVLLLEQALTTHRLRLPSWGPDRAAGSVFPSPGSGRRRAAGSRTRSSSSP